MKINFNDIPLTSESQFAGGQGVCVFNMFKDDTNKIFKITLNPGCSVGFHKHEISQEIECLIEGEVTVMDDNEEYILKPGEVHYCKRYHSHSVINKSDKPAILFCTVTSFE